MTEHKEDIKSLHMKRGSLKTRLTTFKKFIKKCEDDFQKDRTLDDSTILSLELRYSKTEPIINDFEYTQHQIELSPEIDPVAGAYEYEEFENSYFSVLASAKSLLNKVKPSLEDETGSQRASVNSGVSSAGNNFGIKLPTINLPKFHGSYDGWLEFHDTFESLIHNNNSINNIQKFHYLKASLTNEAAQVISSIEMSSSNYTIAWDILCERYKNTQLLIHNHVKGIFNLPNVTNDSAQQLRQLLDILNKHLRSLEALGQPVSSWDTLIIHIITTKLDMQSICKWEGYKRDDLPTIEDLKTFLRERADLLEKIEANKPLNKPTNFRARQQQRSFVAEIQTCSCSFCRGSHRIYNCPDFLKMPIPQRIIEIKNKKICINCLRKGHATRECKSSSCRMCGANHNTLLHDDRKGTINEGNATKPAEANQMQNLSLCNQSLFSHTQVLLSTAIIEVEDEEGRLHQCKALLDSASQTNLVTASFCNKLNLTTTATSISITGINQVKSAISAKSTVKIHSCHNDFSTRLTCFVIPEICKNLPNYNINSNLQIPAKIRLADPTYEKSSEVDILIGAELFWQLTCVGQISLGKNAPTLQKTRLGWVISGPISNNSSSPYCALTVSIERQLSRFWEIEEFSETKPRSDEEIACERHFVLNTSRDENGRFIVSLPLKESLNKLGESRDQSLRRFYTLERKLQRNFHLRELYTEFIHEYIDLNHMSRVEDENLSVHNYYLPHHGVLKEDSLTTKLRVVFDGSAPTTTGLSINDIQMVGPKLQQDLFYILIRFRKHTYVVSADVSKMYRQVLIKPDQRSLQRIFWRDDPASPLKVYNLNTVTYGTTSGAYLAIRSLQQLGHENKQAAPEVARTILEDFYVDDLLTGGNSTDEIMDNCKQLNHILKTGGFELRKWISNNPNIISSFKNPHDQFATLNLGTNENTKTLGLLWSSQHDALLYKISAPNVFTNITKRQILSDTAQIFDPLGLLAPCIILAKILMQVLWSEGISWDDAISSELQTKWKTFLQELEELNKLTIPRNVICRNACKIEIHGFSDASEKAYGACIYLRSINERGTIHSQLMCSKSKVAPLKTLSIPRLELCGALLLIRLAEKVCNALQIDLRCYYWTDSTIVLAWIATSPHLLKVFCANRVAKIRDKSSVEQWRHVPTRENPADLVSRGVQPKNILNLKIWWEGPLWLHQHEDCWPSQPSQLQGIPELKDAVNVLTAQIQQDFPFNKFSTLMRLKACVAYILRFRNNASKSKEHRYTGPLSINELNAAMTKIIKVIQAQHFSDDYLHILGNKPIKSALRFLNPFVKNDIIRVGGRIGNSQSSYCKRHPILLPSKHHVTKLIFLNEHKALMHAGPQHLLASVREKYWPLSGRNMAKQIVHQCVRCFRTKPKQQNYLMGNLPASRVTPAPPFYIAGVDYAGPLLIKQGFGRTNKMLKVYICLFICFSVKAIHLELVLDLTTESFLKALRRFIARRGKPADIYSDNGSNFVGAHNELRQLGEFLRNERNGILESCAREEIKWHFIPPHSPNFGGLWEGAVKSVKHHLKRVIGDTRLNYEQLNTVLIQIESILNSRPLCPMSNDPSDLSSLSPNHFLIGRSSSNIADPNLLNIQTNKLNIHQHIQHMQQCFWKRWSKEYLAELQGRSKWCQQKEHKPQINDMVVIRDDNLPPLRWRLGRIIQLHPGADGVCRVVTIKTSNGDIKRALSKVCFLPSEVQVKCFP